jgi:hypothetical protein
MREMGGLEKYLLSMQVLRERSPKVSRSKAGTQSGYRARYGRRYLLFSFELQ